MSWAHAASRHRVLVNGTRYAVSASGFARIALV